jgi:hypothetical protein
MGTASSSTGVGGDAGQDAKARRMTGERSKKSKTPAKPHSRGGSARSLERLEPQCEPTTVAHRTFLSTMPAADVDEQVQVHRRLHHLP